MSSARSQTPKEKLVQTAAEIVYRQGWNATGINQILGDAKVPKGSFYYYFQSKEDLGVAIVKYHCDMARERYARTLCNESLSGAEAIRRYLDEEVVRQQTDGWRFGCPVGSFSNEIAATTEKIAVACREFLVEWTAAVTQAIARGQRDKTIRHRGEAHGLALLVVSVWQGSMVLMKSYQTQESVTNAVQGICEILF